MSRDYKKINIRRLKAHELRRSGLKWREVGEKIGGVSASRAAQLAAVGERIQGGIDQGRFPGPLSRSARARPR